MNETVLVTRYTAAKQAEWDAFVDKAKNGMFLFKRGYMDYHSDRFADHSLLIHIKGKLTALLPANADGTTIYSHQGLTYGGLLLGNKATAVDVIDILQAINEYYAAQGFRKVIYKAIPPFFHQIPSQEDLYALFRCTDAHLLGRNIGCVIYQDNKLRFTESRKSGIRKARQSGYTVRESHDIDAFWQILNDNLMQKYEARPVHSIEEIKLLISRFPDNIRLFMTYHGDIPVGGTLLYLYRNVVHTQYISASAEGKAHGALDLLFDWLINDIFVHVPVFDLGTSNEAQGTILNESLIFQKQGFGGRAIVSDIYEYSLTPDR